MFLLEVVGPFPLMDKISSIFGLIVQSFTSLYKAIQMLIFVRSENEVLFRFIIILVSSISSRVSPPG